MSYREADAELEKAIYERSAAEALTSGLPDFIENGDGVMWLPGSRSSARAQYAGEYGCRFIDVRATRAYMAIDLDAIADQAHELANDAAQGYDIADDAIAYTYEDYGWLWRDAGRDDPHAVALWRCEAIG